MTEAIIVALITAGASVCCQLLIGRRERERSRRENAENSKLVLYRIDELEEKVQKHNNFIERIYKVEERAKSNTHRLDEMEREH